MDLSTRELPGLFFRKVIRDDMGRVSLDPPMVRLLLAIDENKPIGKIAREVGMNLVSLRETLQKLVRLGLVEPVEKAGAVLNGHFIDDLRAQLARAVGPMAEVLIEETLDDMRLSLSRIPVHLGADLVGNLARQIPREEKRVEFQRAMIERIPR
jgi:predicted transcriptional regulator